MTLRPKPKTVKVFRPDETGKEDQGSRSEADPPELWCPEYIRPFDVHLGHTNSYLPYRLSPNVKLSFPPSRSFFLGWRERPLQVIMDAAAFIKTTDKKVSALVGGMELKFQCHARLASNEHVDIQDVSKAKWTITVEKVKASNLKEVMEDYKKYLED